MGTRIGWCSRTGGRLSAVAALLQGHLVLQSPDTGVETKGSVMPRRRGLGFPSQGGCQAPTVYRRSAQGHKGLKRGQPGPSPEEALRPEADEPTHAVRPRGPSSDCGGGGHRLDGDRRVFPRGGRRRGFHMGLLAPGLGRRGPPGERSRVEAAGIPLLRGGDGPSGQGAECSPRISAALCTDLTQTSSG